MEGLQPVTFPLISLPLTVARFEGKGLPGMQEVQGVERKYAAGQTLKEAANPSHTLLLTRRTKLWVNLFPGKSELKSDFEKLDSEYEDA